MAYGDDEPKRNWFTKVLTIVGGLVAYFVVKALVSGGSSFAFRQTIDAEDVENAIQQNEQIAPFYSEMEKRFPLEYQRFLDESVKMAKSGIDQSAISRKGAEYLRSFIASRLNDITAAPNEYILKIARANVDFTEKLRSEDVSLCAAYATSGLSPNVRLSAASTGLLSDIGVATIVAASEGRKAPVSRNTISISDPDSIAFVESMIASGADEEMIVAISEGKDLAVEKQCESGILIYKSALNLPEERATRIIGFLLRESAKQPIPL